MATEPNRNVRRRYAARLGDRIAQRRADLGLLQEELAEKMTSLGSPIGGKSISAWEYGRPRIATDQLVALACALECTVSFLIGLTDDPAEWVPSITLEEATRAYLYGVSQISDHLAIVARVGGGRKAEQASPIQGPLMVPVADVPTPERS